jgi:hypothetical protein
MSNPWAAVAGAAIGAVGSYLTARENAKAAKDVAKAQAGVTSWMQPVQRAQMMAGGQTVRRGLDLSTILGTPTPPYVDRMAQAGSVAAAARSLPAVAGAAGTVARQLPGVAAGLAGGELIEALVGGRPGRVGGIQIAGSLDDFYTDAGNPRGTVASIDGDRMTFWSNRGVPVIFSRDATLCRRIKKLSGKAYRASGGTSRTYRRKR